MFAQYLGSECHVPGILLGFGARETHQTYSISAFMELTVYWKRKTTTKHLIVKVIMFLPPLSKIN